MSHFQRTRSRVWWGDSPPNIGSPVAQAANWNPSSPPEHDNWEPQLPHIAPEVPEVVMTPVAEQWPHRHGSPGSHKSQDSGFSDSDSSLPVSQYCSSPEIANEKTTNTSSNDSNNNEDVTVKHILEIKDKTAADKIIDETDASINVDKPRPRLRSSSVIQTPLDFEKYMLIHRDEEHLKLYSDRNDALSPNPREIVQNNHSADIKIAKVKDLDTQKNSYSNLEYLQVTDEVDVVLNNKPRIRSPITQVDNIELRKDEKCKRHDFRRSVSCEEHEVSENSFNRDKVNKSFSVGIDTSSVKIIPKDTSKIYVKSSNRGFIESFSFKSAKARIKQMKAEKTSQSGRKIKNKTKKAPEETNLDDWVLLNHPSNERLLQTSNESAPNFNRSVTPPLEFKDPIHAGMKTKKSSQVPKKDLLKKNATPYLDVELSMACMSTPKMLEPGEFMENAIITPKYTKKSEKRRLNLLKDMEENLTTEPKPLETPLEKTCHKQPDSVQYWLCEVISAIQPECMTNLQSKPLGHGKDERVYTRSTVAGNIKKVQTHGRIVAELYEEVLRSITLESRGEEELFAIVTYVRDFVLTHSITLSTKPSGETPERWQKIKETLDEYLEQLSELEEDLKVELNDTNPEWKVVFTIIDEIIDIFLETAKAVQIQQIKTLVSMIEDPKSESELKKTLTSLNHLFVQQSDVTECSERAQKILDTFLQLPFVECELIRALLIALIENRKGSVKALCLRALATVCDDGEAVKQFDEGGGLDILSELLVQESNTEPQQRETITLITQLTAPWLSGNYELSQLHKFLDVFVQKVTAILNHTKCSQYLLLCAACLVNLLTVSQPKDTCSNPDEDILELFSKYDTLKVLLNAVKNQGSSVSVFLQQQTAILLRTLASTKRGTLMVTSKSQPLASVALVSFLRLPMDSEANITPRVLRYTAEAIARLSTQADFASELIQLEAIPRLINIVKTQKSLEKLYNSQSEPILVACLKSLRVIYGHFPEYFGIFTKDVIDMVRPTLLESVLKFSSKQESYV